MDWRLRNIGFFHAAPLSSIAISSLDPHGIAAVLPVERQDRLVLAAATMIVAAVFVADLYLPSTSASALFTGWSCCSACLRAAPPTRSTRLSL